MAEDPFGAAAAAVRELAAAQPGRVEQLVLATLQQQERLIRSLHEQVLEQRLSGDRMMRQLNDLRDEVTRLRSGPALDHPARTDDGARGGAVRNQGSLPLMRHQRTSSDPSLPQSASPVATSPIEQPMPTAAILGLAAVGADDVGSHSGRMSAGGGRSERVVEEVRQLTDVARQRHMELQAADARRRNEGTFVIEVANDPPRQGRGRGRGFQPTERRPPVLPRSVAANAPQPTPAATQTARTAPPIATEPAVATGATTTSAASSTATPTSAASVAGGSSSAQTAPPPSTSSVGASGSPHSQPLQLAQKVRLRHLPSPTLCSSPLPSDFISECIARSCGPSMASSMQ